MTVSTTRNGATGEPVTVGIVEQGEPRLIPAVRDADGALWREGRRPRRLSADAAAVVLPGTHGDEALEQARAAIDTADVATIAARLRNAFGDRPFTVQEAIAAERLDEHQGLRIWLTLWEHPDWFARAGRTSFRVRSEQERAAENARIARRQAEEARLRDAEQALRRLRAGEDTLETLLANQPDVREAAESMLDPDHPGTLGESLRKRIAQLLEQQLQQEGAGWPTGYHVAAALGHRDPWYVGDPTINRHRRWLEQTAREPLPEFSGDELQPWTRLVAIDDAGTTERDDAIGFTERNGRTIVEVAVAWLAETIPDDWDEALAAVGTTIYLPTRDIPLLPEPAGIQRHSLSADEARPALLLRWEIDPTGGANLLSAVAGRVKLAATCTYEQTERALGELWPVAERTAAALLSRRSQSGAGDIEIADVMVEVRDGHPVALRRVEPWTGARHVVREAMILTNMTIAERLAARRLPAPFRGLERMGNSFVTRVDLRPQRHIGIGASAYVYATSPIRRFVDILAQRQFAALLGRRDPMDRDRLRRLLRAAEKGYQASRRWMGLANRYWMLRYLEAHPDTPLTAVVDGSADDRGRLRVRLEPVGLTTEVDVQRSPSGSTFALRLVDVDAEANRLVVEPA